MTDLQNQKITVQEKTPAYQRVLRPRDKIKTELSSSTNGLKNLPTIIPISQTKQIEWQHIKQNDILHITIKIPLPQMNSHFSNTRSGIPFKNYKFDMKISRTSTSKSILLESKLSNKKIDESFFEITGKLCWVEDKTEIRYIKGKNKKITPQYNTICNNKVDQSVSDVFLDLYFSISRQQPVSLFKGLVNQGNTCYMNSYLQMLYHLQKFRQIIFDLQKSPLQKFPGSLQNLFWKLTQSKKKSVTTQDLSKSYGWSKRDTDVQQDIQQFSCLMLDALQKKVSEQTNKQLGISLHKLFKGKLIHYIQCLDGIDYRSQTAESILDIQLNIKGMNNLMESFEHYIQAQVLQGDNLYKTDEFGACRAQKGISVDSLPQVLMIHLKRFEFDFETDVNRKIMTRYQYPSTVDFSKILNKKVPSYKLYGVLIHQGMHCNSGHYYSFIKIHNKWYKFNDQIVTQASQDQVFENNFGGKKSFPKLDVEQLKYVQTQVDLESTAYMLVYYNSSLENQLFNQLDRYPTWLQQQKMEQQNVKTKSSQHIQILITDWSLIKSNKASSCGLLTNISLDDGSSIEAKVVNELISQFQSIKSYIKYVADINGVNEQEITVWLHDYNKGKQILVSPFTSKSEDPTFNQLFKNRDNKLLIFLHKKRNLVSNLDTFQTYQHSQSQPKFDTNMAVQQNSVSILSDYQVQQYMLNNTLVVCVIKTFIVSEDKQTKFEYNTFYYVKKDTPFSTLQSLLYDRYQNQNFTLQFYKQKKNFEVQLIDSSQTINDTNSKNRLCTIIVEAIHKSLSSQYSLLKYFNTEKNKVNIELINEQTNQITEVFLRKNMKMSELRSYINSHIYASSNEEEADYIMIKYRSNKNKKLSQAYQSTNNVDQLVKYDSTLYYKKTVIKANDRENTAIYELKYRNKHTFEFSPSISVVSSKKTKTQTLLDSAKQNSVIENNIQKDSKGIRLLSFDPNGSKILKSFSSDEQPWTILNKSKVNLVIESITSQPNTFFTTLVHNKARNSYLIGIPFTLQIKKQLMLKQILQLLLDSIRTMKFQFQEKIHELNEKKLRVTIYPSSLTPGRGTVIDSQKVETLTDLYPQDQQFCIQVFHNSISPAVQTMKINLDD